MAAEELTDDELLRIEREHPQGISSEDIVAVFSRKGIKFTEATLRKYVQLGLLPRSRRVALKGNQRGSLGLYPAGVVRRIVNLKSMLRERTIEELQREFFFVRTDVEELERTLEQIFSVLGRAAKASRAGEGVAKMVQRELTDARSLAADLVARITSVETRLMMQARLERKAIGDE